MQHLDLHSDQRLRLAKEMYLKAILQLSQEGEGVVKPKDLVICLGVTKGSVSEMVKKLEEEGFLKYESFKSINLTAKGKRKANLILKRYHIIVSFLEKSLKLQPNKIHAEACRLEHAFSDDSIESMEFFLANK